MKKYLLVSSLFAFALLFAYSIPVARALDCVPGNPGDVSRDCFLTIRCDDGSVHTSPQGCMTPAGCSTPPPDACSTSYTVTTPTGAPATGSGGTAVVPPVTTGGGNTGGSQTFAPITATSANCIIPTGKQSCSSVPLLTVNTPNPSACTFSGSESAYLQQNVTGTGPTGSTNYNPADYATGAAATQLASCLGGSIVLTSTQAPASHFQIPPTFEIVFPNGVHENVASLIGEYFAKNGNQQQWGNYVNQIKATGGGSTGTTGSTGGSTGSGTGTSLGLGGSSSAVPSATQQMAQVQTGIFASINNAINNAEQQYKGTMILPTYTQPGNTGPTSGTCFRLNSDLRLGSNNSSVGNLTSVLVLEGFLTKTQNNFDTSVFNAVVSYQEKYAANILSPVGLTQGTGYVGPSTRAYINSHLSCTTS